MIRKINFTLMFLIIISEIASIFYSGKILNLSFNLNTDSLYKTRIMYIISSTSSLIQVTNSINLGVVINYYNFSIWDTCIIF